MWALVSGKSFMDFQFGADPVIHWAERIWGSATPIMVDIFVLVLAASAVSLILWRMNPVRRKALALKRDMTHRR
jgi:hypothetical protein